MKPALLISLRAASHFVLPRRYMLIPALHTLWVCSLLLACDGLISTLKWNLSL